MTTRHHPNYLAIWIWLAVFMLLSVLAASLPAAAQLIIGIILVLALIKAALVALYYMHLRFERKLLWLIVIGPLLLAAALIVPVLVDSYAARQAASTFSSSSTPHTDAAHPTE